MDTSFEYPVRKEASHEAGLVRKQAELSVEGCRRLKWMRYYEENGCNARRTCRHFHISAQTFYRWRRRYKYGGPVTLETRSRRPRRHRQPTWNAAAEAAVLRLRQQYPGTGKNRLAIFLRREGYNLSTSMIGRILRQLRQRGVLLELGLHAAPRSTIDTTSQAKAGARRGLGVIEKKRSDSRELRKTQLRLRIYEKALELFRRKGYAGTRIEDIVRDLEIGRATLFRYFPNKEALLQEYIKRYYLRVLEASRIQLSTTASTAARLISICETLAGEMEADRHLWHAIVFAGMTNPWRSPEAYELDRPSRELLEAIILKGRERGDVGHSFNVGLLTQFMEGLHIAIISEWAGAPHSSYPLAERLRMAAAFFLAAAKL